MNRDVVSIEAKNTRDLLDSNMNHVAVVPSPEGRYNAPDDVADDEVLKNLIDVPLPIKGDQLIFCHHAESDIVTSYRRELPK